MRSIASEVGRSFGAVQTILTDSLDMSKVSARWVPRMLTDDQKRSRLDISRYLLSRYEDDPEDFIDRVVHGFITLTQSQKCKACNRSTLAHPLPRRLRVSSAGKVVASAFWDSQGVIMIDYLEQGRTINGAYYAAELRRLRQEIARKRRDKLTRGVLLLQENAPAQKSKVAMIAATECGFEVLPHPPYSPDMAPSDFYLFPKLKSNLRGTQF